MDSEVNDDECSNANNGVNDSGMYMIYCEDNVTDKRDFDFEDDVFGDEEINADDIAAVGVGFDDVDKFNPDNVIVNNNVAVNLDDVDDDVGVEIPADDINDNIQIRENNIAIIADNINIVSFSEDEEEDVTEEVNNLMMDADQVCNCVSLKCKIFELKYGTKCRRSIQCVRGGDEVSDPANVLTRSLLPLQSSEVNSSDQGVNTDVLKQTVRCVLKKEIVTRCFISHKKGCDACTFFNSTIAHCQRRNFRSEISAEYWRSSFRKESKKAATILSQTPNVTVVKTSTGKANDECIAMTGYLYAAINDIMEDKPVVNFP